MLESGKRNLVPGTPVNPIYSSLVGENTPIDHDPYGLFEFDDPRKIELERYKINPICQRVIAQFQELFDKQ